ncbi:hypothetical protein BgiBS90_030950 [Biomphalaria glabrata]|nr:hypothetical protein BgiBS90_030950 [Biomphalaria glabrata]
MTRYTTNSTSEALEENNMKQKFELFHPTTERLDDFLQNNLKPLDAALWDNNLKPLDAALWDNNLKPLDAALWDNNLKPLDAALWDNNL